MRKDIIDIDKEKGLVQVTTPDERWYGRLNDKDEREWIPSVTWITNYYPKGKGFELWLASKGIDESEQIKREAGTKGTKIHKAIENLVSGLPVKMDDKFENKETGELEELTVDEYEATISFANWWKTLKNPKLIMSEEVCWNNEHNYAGTIDLVLEIDGVKWIIDLKSSKDIYPSHRLQVSAYKHALAGDYKLGILQVGYPRNKNKYKFTEIEDQFDLFLSAQKIWANETAGQKPLQRDFPIEIKL